MNVDRRTFIRSVAASFIGLSTAGCTGNQTSNSDFDTTNQTNGVGNKDTATENKPTTETERASLKKRKITSGRGSCDTMQYASISPSESGVTVTGGIPASNPCHRAVLTDTSLTKEGGKNQVGVKISVEDGDEDSCRNCLAVIEYTAELGFDQMGPVEVVVDHQQISGEVSTIASEELND